MCGAKPVISADRERVLLGISGYLLTPKGLLIINAAKQPGVMGMEPLVSTKLFMSVNVRGQAGSPGSLRAPRNRVISKVPLGSWRLSIKYTWVSGAPSGPQDLVFSWIRLPRTG